MDEATINEQIEYINSIDTGAAQKAELVLVLLGLIPAAELLIYPHNLPPEEIERLLDQTGLIYVRRAKKRLENTTAEYGLSRDKNTANEMVNATSFMERTTLTGYPKTAIDAIENGTTYDGNIPEDIDNSLFRLKFSKDHFEDEFEVIRKWNRAIADYAPHLA